MVREMVIEREGKICIEYVSHIVYLQSVAADNSWWMGCQEEVLLKKVNAPMYRAAATKWGRASRPHVTEAAHN